VSDLGFERSLRAVSGDGSLAWTPDQLYYAVSRAVRRRRPIHRLARRKVVSLRRGEFDRLLARWQGLGLPLTGRMADRLPDRQPDADLAADVAGLAMDRAVICDRAQTAEFLLSNRFHVEHRCVVLSEDGHPAGAFADARGLLQRSESLIVATLHDADPGGCGLIRRLCDDPAWFASQVADGRARVVDLGLRPRSANRFRGSFRSASSFPDEAAGANEWETRWLARYRMEVAAVPPRLLLAALPSAWSEDSSSSALEVGDPWMWPRADGDEDFG
jgi:hypothetical protein